MIEVENLVKHFSNVKAVDGVSFSVARGEVFGLLGPNGAGKTTTIRTMMDIIKPDSGAIRLMDQPVTEEVQVDPFAGRVRGQENPHRGRLRAELLDEVLLVLIVHRAREGLALLLAELEITGQPLTKVRERGDSLREDDDAVRIASAIETPLFEALE